MKKSLVRKLDLKKFNIYQFKTFILIIKNIEPSGMRPVAKQARPPARSPHVRPLLRPK